MASEGTGRCGASAPRNRPEILLACLRPLIYCPFGSAGAAGLGMRRRFPREGADMQISRPSPIPPLLAAGLLLAATGLSACAGGRFTHSSDPSASFPEVRTYQWAPTSVLVIADPLLEANVRFQADRVLEAKGFRKAAEGAELLVSMTYEYEVGSYYRRTGDRLRLLTLGVARAQNREPMWRGTAAGPIDVGSGSGDLEAAVKGILASLPPR